MFPLILSTAFSILLEYLQTRARDFAVQQDGNEIANPGNQLADDDIQRADNVPDFFGLFGGNDENDDQAGAEFDIEEFSNHLKRYFIPISNPLSTFSPPVGLKGSFKNLLEKIGFCLTILVLIIGEFFFFFNLKFFFFKLK